MGVQIRVAMGPGAFEVFVAVCPCGWEGWDRATPQQADEDFERHLIVGCEVTASWPV